MMSNLTINPIAAKSIYSRFFIIKSYSEENVQKAFKYNLWSSTVKGNQILDQAFLDLQKFKGIQNTELEGTDENEIAEA
jgi:hypothetical protein